MPSDAFADLIRRVRAGDQQADTELVDRYARAIVRTVSVRLRNQPLGRVLDAEDICQSVLLNFFVRIRAGQWDLNTSEALLKLLTKMARNKLINHLHRERAQQRDHRRNRDQAVTEWDVVDPGPSPSQYLASQELLQEIRRRLTPPERQLQELREQGLGWAEIAALLGGTADGLRKQLSRGIDRVARELGLDEVDHE